LRNNTNTASAWNIYIGKKRMIRKGAKKRRWCERSPSEQKNYRRKALGLLERIGWLIKGQGDSCNHWILEKHNIHIKRVFLGYNKQQSEWYVRRNRPDGQSHAVKNLLYLRENEILPQGILTRTCGVDTCLNPAHMLLRLRLGNGKRCTFIRETESGLG